MGFDFIVIAPFLPSHCGFSFVFACGVSFLVSSSVFLLMIALQVVVIPVFSKDGVRACPSTPPSWTNPPLLLIFKGSLYILEPKSFVTYVVCKFLILVCSLSFHPLNWWILHRISLFDFDEITFIKILLYHVLNVMFMKSSLNPIPEDFLLKNFVLHLQFKKFYI